VYTGWAKTCIFLACYNITNAQLTVKRFSAQHLRGSGDS